MHLHAFHKGRNAQFIEVNDIEAVGDYANILAEHQALRDKAGILDLSFRGRLCLTGTERARFLHGQVTNDIKSLLTGRGCYAALVNAKGRMQSDLNIYCLAEELLLDFEPGLTPTVLERLEKYIVADDVQALEVMSLYGLISVQGPLAEKVIAGLELFGEIPNNPFDFVHLNHASFGEIYLMNQARLRTTGFDLFIPKAALDELANRADACAKKVGGCWCGWQALEIARIEAGIPRFRIDMDETNFPQECGIESQAVSYTKGCYIGQEVLNRIHTMGHVNRRLCGLRLADDLPTLPARGDKLYLDGKEVGSVTSVVASPALKANIGLGYVREGAANAIGTKLTLRSAGGEIEVQIVQTPFR